MKKIEIYDTTLRDGTQGEGVNLSLQDKLDITVALDELGVDFVEGGWPGSNPKDVDFFNEVKDLEFKSLKISAFGSTHRVDSEPEDDFLLAKLIEAEADLTCIFGKSWDLHVGTIGATPDRNLEMIQGSIEYLAKKTLKPVFYDAEHFFDGYNSDPGYAIATVQAAVNGGAERIILCDTNGGALPHEIAVAIKDLVKSVQGINLGIHVHNDGGLAVANTLRAIEEGAIQVQGSINGIGERCGNVDLTTVLANLELKLGYRCLPKGQIKGLTNLSRKVWEYLGSKGPLGQPFVGPSAFAHKGGVHVSAVQKNPETYEHVSPDVIGNSRKVLISELSGGSNLRAKLANRYPELEGKTTVSSILGEIQDKEHSGYSFENADGSFDLIVRRYVGKYKPVFKPIYYRIYALNNEDYSTAKEFREGLIEAAVKVRVGENTSLCAAEGHGPIDALNKALQKALRNEYPVISDLHLTDYSVKVINSSEETAAKVRVLVEHSFEGEKFGTVGVNTDIIEASWNALTEAYHYSLMQHVEFVRELHR
ncbi:MAG: citramalate synthase [Gammaproteobacteria bacterium]|uniref:Citramalate synthase n=1 Tax=OM182 bacterium TaxID=2510334 RepID=A0A520RX57_9GAMM|nr:citramalate synthase [Gammaproteobacteria bacterium]OUV67331.1 MAG: citramalate synthase [Gammaproteobacteria bacterium TMED133]RZO74816.1 MAG: citramalate synthase [OM182 bacterium]